MLTPHALAALAFLAGAPLAQAHTAAEEAQLIRESREAALADRANPLEAAASCRYISDISTPPPLMRVALTFDDGPDPEGTPYILDVLKKYRVSATFFMIGSSAEKYPDLVQRVVKEGHLIVANHSWTHPDFHKISTSEQAAELKKNLALLGQYQHPKFFRYPYGNSTCATNDLAHSLGYKIVGWHVDSCDWAFNATGKVSFKDANICEVQPQFMADFRGHVVDRLHHRAGGILLMHEIQPNTIHQLDQLLATLVHDGFSFGTLDEKAFQPSMR